MTEKLNLRAYYYEFESTGNLVVDKILEAVACAGKAYHSTEFWYGDDGADETDYIALIQDAANKAAAVPAPSKAEVARELLLETEKKYSQGGYSDLWDAFNWILKEWEDAESK